MCAITVEGACGQASGEQERVSTEDGGRGLRASGSDKTNELGVVVCPWMRGMRMERRTRSSL